jgi:hypothetical protein
MQASLESLGVQEDTSGHHKLRRPLLEQLDEEIARTDSLQEEAGGPNKAQYEETHEKPELAAGCLCPWESVLKSAYGSESLNTAQASKLPEWQARTSRSYADTTIEVILGVRRSWVCIRISASSISFL